MLSRVKLEESNCGLTSVLFCDIEETTENKISSSQRYDGREQDGMWWKDLELEAVLFKLFPEHYILVQKNNILKLYATYYTLCDSTKI
jgi:hypothetical protein